MSFSVTSVASVLAIVDRSSARSELVSKTLLPALRFWGVPLKVFDLATDDHRALEPARLAAIMILQDGLAPERVAVLNDLIGRAAAAGAGIVNCDPTLEFETLTPLKITSRGWAGTRGVAEAIVPSASRFVAALQGTVSAFRFNKRIAALPSRGLGFSALAATDGTPLLVLRDGAPRVADWGLAPTVWAADGFGFARGLDALLWRSLVWVARKPFSMAAFPPLGRFRFDDCRGFWREARDLAFLDVMREFGEIPNLGICLDALSPEAWALLGERARAGMIEVVPHVQGADRGIFNVPELDETADPDFLARSILDLFRKHGCPMGRSVSDHNHEISPRGVRIARALGMTSRMNVLRLGETWDGEHRRWSPAPFGCLHYALDRFVDAPELFTAINHHSSFGETLTRLDDGRFLCSPFSGFEADRWDFLNGLVDHPAGNDVEGIVARLLRHAELALNSLFFVGSISHTHFMRHLTADEWRIVLRAYRDFVDPHGYRPMGYDGIADCGAWRAGLGPIRIESGASSGEALWGFVAREGADGPAMEWSPLAWAQETEGDRSC